MFCHVHNVCIINVKIVWEIADDGFKLTPNKTHFIQQKYVGRRSGVFDASWMMMMWHLMVTMAIVYLSKLYACAVCKWIGLVYCLNLTKNKRHQPIARCASNNCQQPYQYRYSKKIKRKYQQTKADTVCAIPGDISVLT